MITLDWGFIPTLPISSSKQVGADLQMAAKLGRLMPSGMLLASPSPPSRSHTLYTDPDSGFKPNCLPGGPNSSSSLRSLQSACPVFKQSCLESLRIKTSGKLQAQTSASLSLKQNTSFYMFAHPKTHTPIQTQPSLCPSESFYKAWPKYTLGTC